MLNRLTRPSVAASLAGLILGFLMLATKASSLGGALFFVPFSLGPLVVTAAIGMFCRGRVPQVILMVAALAYLAWFAWVYSSAFYWHPDPQSPIALVFVGAYSLPIQIPLWVAAVIIAARAANRANKSE